jgi:hypothetical protein
MHNAGIASGHYSIPNYYDGIHRAQMDSNPDVWRVLKDNYLIPCTTELTLPPDLSEQLSAARSDIRALAADNDALRDRLSKLEARLQGQQLSTP